MANKDYYDILGVGKGASQADIKKAYRKKAMEWHPDKHRGDKKAEDKFKEINEAYQILGDENKRKQYDTFGSSDFSGFGGGAGQGFGGFEDIFRNFGGGARAQNDFDMGDIFSDLFAKRNQKTSGFSGYDSYGQSSAAQKKETVSLDVEKIYEVPVMDLLLGTKIDIQTVYNENLKLKIPELTKPGTRFKIKGKGRSSGGKTGDMFVITEAKMPKSIPDDVKKLLESIKYRL